ncbi:MAG: NPCBM/NEW2 domain-containing protein [Planctomycetes bacterium]|nr:NPCBM/NEW2 domain-containing protein [Planctomycetota bacterium]
MTRTGDQTIGRRAGRPANPMRLAIGCLLLATAAAASHAGVEVEITRLDGQRVRGEITQLVPMIVLHTGGDRVSLSWPDVLSVRPVGGHAADTQPAAPEAPLRFQLGDGSRFCGRISAANAAGCEITLPTGQTGQVNLIDLAGVVSSAAGAEALAKLSEIQQQANAAPSGSAAGRDERDRGGQFNDVAVVSGADEVLVLRGTVRALEPGRALFEWNGRDVRLPWSRVAGIVLARPAPSAAACTARLRDGSAFAGRIIGGSATGAVLQSSVFDRLELGWGEIVELACRSERIVLLSALRPVRYEFVPFFDKRWEYAVDRTLTGQPIRLAGREYASGVTMHSRATLVYALDGGFRQFAAVVGIADEVGARGCVMARVLCDQQPVWEARGLRGGGPPQEIAIDVAGASELSLEIDYDEDLDLGDHACWAFARLIR